MRTKTLFLNKALAVFLLGLVIMLGGCTRDSIVPEQVSKIQSQGLSSSGVRYEQYQGRVAVQAVNHALIIVRVQALDSDTTSRIFTFQVEDKLNRLFTSRFKQATVTFFSHGLYIQDHANVYRFSVNEERGLQDAALLEKDLRLKPQYYFSGIGLGKMWGRWVGLPETLASEASFDAVAYKLLQHNISPDAHQLLANMKTSPNGVIEPEEVTCDSGGSGSSSCSTNACTVSCKPFFYSCCTGASCKCIAGN